jgi:DNA-binding NtrC family response regulator
MKCHVVDERPEFFGIFAEKIGSEFQFSTLDRTRRSMEEIADCDVIIVSLPMPASAYYDQRVEAMQRIVLNPAAVPVIGFLGEPDRTAMRAVIASGAYDCFVESSPLEELRIVLRRAARFHDLQRELNRLRASTQPMQSEFLVSADTNMMAVHSFARRIATSDASVLITGETGTGKEVIARDIHRASGRSQYPFVPVACSSLPETLIEAELFGHERGAFTGATMLRRGRFEVAERGTIFLDEIGELTPSLQVKLLRVLQECEFERLGSNKPRPMEARVICATNCDLKAMVQAGKFRADLFYRLNTVEVHMPPLRERRDDIVALALFFLQRYAKRQDRPACRISPVALSALRRYDWPGNVRELEHVIERAVVICDIPEIRSEHLPPDLVRNTIFNAEQGGNCLSFEDEVKTFKRRLIHKALQQAGQNKVRAARTLSISRSSLHRLIDELDVLAGTA